MTIDRALQLLALLTVICVGVTWMLYQVGAVT